jgi:precorrin-6Y C5,15-methyltransferase (decarboxylating)
MSRWLSIVGIGEDGFDALTPAARALIENADLVIGGKRHLAMLPENGNTHMPWPQPLHDAVNDLPSHKDKKVCIVSTGDPFCYGIGRLVSSKVPISEVTVVPAPSAFSLACSRLGWAMAEIDTLTLHGRPGPLLEPAIQPGVRLLILSQTSETPSEVAERLKARGFGDSMLHVLERLGGARERIRSATAAEWAYHDSDPLHVIGVECVAGPDARHLSRFEALPDDAYRHDGQLTKQEVRSATLAALAPAPGQLLWDVGAGCGSIGIEWMRRDRRNRALAIEPKTERRTFIAENALALGTPGLAVIDGTAPGALKDLEAPDAVFIGGGLSTDGVFDACWDALRPGGRLVANAVTLESEQRLLSLYETNGGSLTRIAVSRAEPVGRLTGWKPMMPVTQWAVTKSADGRKP